MRCIPLGCFSLLVEYFLHSLHMLGNVSLLWPILKFVSHLSHWQYLCTVLANMYTFSVFLMFFFSDCAAFHSSFHFFSFSLLYALKSLPVGSNCVFSAWVVACSVNLCALSFPWIPIWLDTQHRVIILLQFLISYDIFRTIGFLG